MSKSWTPEELAAASAAMKAKGHMSYEDFCAAPVLRRRSRPADIYTKQGNAFDGEPCDPVPEGTIIEFVPARDTWDF